MPKVKVVVRELDDVNVDYVSIVKRGANRIPFRIIKKERGESTMLDLSSLFVRKKEKVELEPQLVGIVLAKGDYSEEQLTQFNDVGLVGVVDQSQDNVTIIKSEGYDEAQDVAAITMSNGIVAVYANIKKSISLDEGSMFADVVAVNSIYPSIRVASDTLQDFIYRQLYQEADKATTIGSISVMLDDYKSYVMSLFNAVPDTLYKLEKMEAPVVKGESEEEAKAEETETQEEVQVEKSDESVVTEEANTQTEQEEVAKSEAPDDEALEVVKAELDSLKGMLASITQSLSVIDTVNEKVTTLTSRIEKAEKDSNDALALLNGSTIADAHEDATLVPTKKSESVYNSAILFPGFEIS